MSIQVKTIFNSMSIIETSSNVEKHLFTFFLALSEIIWTMLTNTVHNSERWIKSKKFENDSLFHRLNVYGDNSFKS